MALLLLLLLRVDGTQAGTQTGYVEGRQEQLDGNADGIVAGKQERADVAARQCTLHPALCLYRRTGSAHPSSVSLSPFLLMSLSACVSVSTLCR